MADFISMLAGAGGAAPSNAWDLSKAAPDGGSPQWDISKGIFVNLYTSSLSGYTDIYISPDGTRVYVSTGDDYIRQFSLSVPWIINSITFIQEFDAGPQETGITGVDFKPDGTKMYICGTVGDDVNEYTLSTAWDVSTASYVQNFSVAAQESLPESLRFKPDGTKMYVLGDSGNDVNEYSLSTAWDISTASYVQNFSVSAQETDLRGLFFKPDGTKMYVAGTAGDDINEYSLSTPWDISTASYVQNFSVIGQTTGTQGIFFHPDGNQFYVAASRDASGNLQARIIQYACNGLSVAAQEASASSLFFKPDGTKLYVLGRTGDDVNEYSLSTAWELSTASYVQNFSVLSQDTTPQGLFFKPDGTKMYVLGDAGDDVNEYTLSVAWDISTASYVQVFSVAGQETSPRSIFFKPDGTKMYVTGISGDDVNEYNLSTPWDISTASYVQVFSVAGQETAPFGLFFKPDGTKMYVTGQAEDNINEYSLSTPWNVSTASFVAAYQPSFPFTNPEGIYFLDDGLKFFVLFDSNTIVGYKIS